MTPNNQPIGLFDSGVGGLTVLREFERILPDESVLYFGDTARLPYGTRTPEEILAFVRDILDWMAARNVKMAVMACNTSSALALDIVRREYGFPVLGLIFPGARAAVKTGRRVGVIATPATASSGAYSQAMREICPEAQVWEVGCPDFVPIVEGDRIHDPATLATAREYLQPLLDRQIDTLVYGCTHYPHLSEVVRTIVGDRVTCIDPAVHLTRATVRELDLLGLHAAPSAHRPTQFFVSGKPSQFAELSSRWLGHRPGVERVRFAPPPEVAEVATVTEPAIEPAIERADRNDAYADRPLVNADE
ncbi:MAG: glutamate racemase [Geitlerinemataceae cyanobacterium]